MGQFDWQDAIDPLDWAMDDLRPAWLAAINARLSHPDGRLWWDEYEETETTGVWYIVLLDGYTIFGGDWHGWFFVSWIINASLADLERVKARLEANLPWDPETDG